MHKAGLKNLAPIPQREQFWLVGSWNFYKGVWNFCKGDIFGLL